MNYLEYFIVVVYVVYMSIGIRMIILELKEIRKGNLNDSR